ncbi:hypothetical protein F66182_4560 [Fusarium sp. NRRL 66182]|nr:hypothetical protein F66182_4560 [Fusarium sp. NRRL 66182]
MYRIWNIYALAAIGTIGGMLFGFDISSMSAWIGTEQYRDYFNDPGSTAQGGITASMSAGSFIGALIAGVLADRLGRRGSLMIACAFWIIGAVLQCSAQNVAHLIVGRVVSGFAVGITSSQVLVYLAELAPSNIRGRVVGIQQWSIEWGILIMYLISYGCAVGVQGPASFRIAWGIQAVPGFVLLGGLFFFPESPRWLAQHDRWEEAHCNLAHLHAGGDLDSPVVVAEMEEVREAVRIANESKDIGYLGLLAPGVWKRTVVGVSVQIWQQLLGGNVMLYYLVYIFNMAGMTGNTALTSSIIQYVIFLVTTGLVLPLIDRLGRRPLLVGGAIICGILHFSSGAVMASYGYPVDGIDGNENLTWAIKGPAAQGVIALAYIFVGVYGLTWAPAAWIYASEVFPLKYRAKGVGLAAAGNWIFNLALAFFVPPAFENIQWQTYIIFGTFCIAMTFHVLFTYPETARKTLEEVDVIFESSIPAWRSAKASGGFGDKETTHAETAQTQSSAAMSQRPKTDSELKAEWSPKEWEYYRWYDENALELSEARNDTAEDDAYEKLLSSEWPDAQDRAGFDKWLDQWCHRWVERQRYRIPPQELVEKLKEISFLYIHQAENLYWSILTPGTPFVPLGESDFGGVLNGYGLGIGGMYMWPNSMDEEPGVSDGHMLGIHLDTDESGNSWSVINNNNNQADAHDSSFVFAQLGELFAFHGNWEDARGGDPAAIRKGPWRGTDYGVVLRLSEEGVPGGIYVVYNYIKSEDDLISESDGPGEPPRRNEDTAFVVPGRATRCSVAKIANSLDEVGDYQKRLDFSVLADTQRLIVRAKVVDSDLGHVFKPCMVRQKSSLADPEEHDKAEDVEE